MTTKTRDAASYLAALTFVVTLSSPWAGCVSRSPEPAAQTASLITSNEAANPSEAGVGPADGTNSPSGDEESVEGCHAGSFSHAFDDAEEALKSGWTIIVASISPTAPVTGYRSTGRGAVIESRAEIRGLVYSAVIRYASAVDLDPSIGTQLQIRLPMDWVDRRSNGQALRNSQNDNNRALAEQQRQSILLSGSMIAIIHKTDDEAGGYEVVRMFPVDLRSDTLIVNTLGVSRGTSVSSFMEHLSRDAAYSVAIRLRGDFLASVHG